MFTAGDYYLERIVTSRLTFTADGAPVVSEMQHGPVLEVDYPATVEELKKLDSVDVLQPNQVYMRLFQAPLASFDSEGRLETPRFRTIAFYEQNREYLAVIRQPYNASEICQSLPDAVVALFGDPENITLVRVDKTDV